MNWDEIGQEQVRLLFGHSVGAKPGGVYITAVLSVSMSDSVQIITDLFARAKAVEFGMFVVVSAR